MENVWEQRNTWKGSPVFPEGKFQTQIRVPFHQSNLCYQFKAFAAVFGWTDLYNGNAIPGRWKFTSPTFCVPFTQTMNRQRSGLWNQGLRNIKGRVSKCGHDSIHEVNQVQKHVRPHRMGFPSVKVTKVVGQEPNIHELLFLRNLVLRICPPGTAISLYQGSTNSLQLHESHVMFFLNI